MTHPNDETPDANAENEALLNGYWTRAMEALVQQGVPWQQAAASMLSIAALQVEAALGLEMAERSLGAARDYMARKRDASEQLDKIVSNKRHS